MNAAVTHQRAAASETRGPIRSLWGLWAAGTGVAVILVAGAHQVAEQVADPLVASGTGEVTLGNVIGMTVVGATVGAALAFALGRFTRRPRRAFLAVALTALAGYAVVPIAAAESLETALWLNVFHFVVAVPMIVMLTHYLPSDRALAGA